MRSLRPMLLVMTMCVPAIGAAQDQAPAPTVREAAERAFAQLPPARVESGTRIWRCCNKKGAIIGAAIGAGIGYWIGHACEFDCPSSYAKSMAILGGIGATVGAFTDIRPRPASPSRFHVGVTTGPSGPTGAVRVHF